MSYNVNELAANLRALRAKAHLSQSEVSQALNISKSTLNGWENGQGGMNLSNAVAIADYYGVRIDDLVSDNH